MPNVTTNYVFFSSGKSETRAQRHAGGGPGGFQQAGPASYTANLTPNQPYPWPQSPFEIPVSLPIGDPNPTYKFAFVSVSGGEPGSTTSFDPNNPPAFLVADSPVNIMVVYVPIGVGVPGGDTGANIDAFDETTGTLVDDEFAMVTPDTVAELPGDSLTSDGNLYGWVDTQYSAEAITATDPIEPTNANFDRWVDLVNGPQEQGSHVYNAPQGSSPYALAFYNQRKRGIVHIPPFGGVLVPTIIIYNSAGQRIGFWPGLGGPPVVITVNPDGTSHTGGPEYGPGGDGPAGGKDR